MRRCIRKTIYQGGEVSKLLDWDVYNKMYKTTPPSQEKLEYFFYLQFVKQYFLMRGVENPMIVEIGVRGVKQSLYYREFIGGDYLGVDIQDKGRDFVIQGDSRDVATVEKLKDKLKGRAIDLLFIDGDHAYDTVKSDWLLYSPLVKYLVGFHDICWELDWMPDEIGDNPSVRQFWEELYEDRHQMISFECPDLIAIEDEDGTVELAYGDSGIGVVLMDRKLPSPRVKYTRKRFQKMWGEDGRAYPRYKRYG